MPNQTVPTDSALNFLFGTYGNGGYGSLRPPGPHVRVLYLLIIPLDHWNYAIPKTESLLLGLRSILIPAL